MYVSTCCYDLANNDHTVQIKFLQEHKEPSLRVLLRHMPEAEALRFLHGVVDVSGLGRKLQKRYQGEKVVEEVPLCVLIR